MNRDFKGIWVPREIWLHKAISNNAKLLWSEIWSLHDRESGGCYASNEYLSDFMSVKVTRLKEIMKELRDNDLLQDVSFDGRNRIIRAKVPPADYGGHQLAGIAATPQPENRPAICRKTGRYPYIENKEEKKEKKDAATPLATFFYEKLKSINPKIKQPNLQVWEKELCRIRKDGEGSTDEEIRKVIEYLVSTHGSTSSNGFCWANVTISATSLRKNYGKIWAEMNSKKGESNGVEGNYEVIKKLFEKFQSRMDIVFSEQYIEFLNGPTSNHIRVDDKNFKDKVRLELKKRKLIKE